MPARSDKKLQPPSPKQSFRGTTLKTVLIFSEILGQMSVLGTEVLFWLGREIVAIFMKRQRRPKS